MLKHASYSGNEDSENTYNLLNTNSVLFTSCLVHRAIKLVMSLGSLLNGGREFH